MSTPAGDLSFLDHPVAQRLLSSTEPAQLAYSWLDGTPRTIPIWFHWDGKDIVLTTPPRAPKLVALQANPQVAVSIDEHAFPYKILYVRGVASVEMLDDISPEYAAAAERYFWARAGEGLGGAIARAAERTDPCDASVGQRDRLRDAIPERARGLRARSCLSRRHRVRAGRGADQQDRQLSNPGPHSRTGSERSAWR